MIMNEVTTIRRTVKTAIPSGANDTKKKIIQGESILFNGNTQSSRSSKRASSLQN